MKHTIHLTNINRSLEVAPGTTVLEAALDAEIDYPYGCATGNCGLCLSELHEGEVTLLPYADGALRPEMQARGRTLACRAQPCSDVRVTWLTNPEVFKKT